MELEGKITILVDRDGARIEVNDEKSNTTFVNIHLTAEQFMTALARQAYVSCKITTNALQNVGKKYEHKKFIFEINEEQRIRRNAAELAAIAQSQLKEGWTAMAYFSSRDSIFEKDGKFYARCIIKRWV